MRRIISQEGLSPAAITLSEICFRGHYHLEDLAFLSCPMCPSTREWLARSADSGQWNYTEGWQTELTEYRLRCKFLRDLQSQLSSHTATSLTYRLSLKYLDHRKIKKM